MKYGVEYPNLGDQKTCLNKDKFVEELVSVYKADEKIAFIMVDPGNVPGDLVPDDLPDGWSFFELAQVLTGGDEEMSRSVYFLPPMDQEELVEWMDTFILKN